MRCFETRNRYARRQQLPARPFRKTNFCLRVGHLEFTSISASSLRNMLTRRSTMPVFRPMLQTITFHCVLLLIRAMRCRLRNRTSIKTKQKSKKKKVKSVVENELASRISIGMMQRFEQFVYFGCFLACTKLCRTVDVVGSNLMFLRDLISCTICPVENRKANL